MSRTGNCWDNAVAESFLSSLKKEQIKEKFYKNRRIALDDIADYIDSFYNAERRHSHLGFTSPSSPSGLDYVQPVIILGAEHLRLCDDWGAISEEVCSRLAKDGQAALPIIWRSY